MKITLTKLITLIRTLGRSTLHRSLYHILQGNVGPSCLSVVEQGSNPAVKDCLIRVQEPGVQVKHIDSHQRGRWAGINPGLEQAETTFPSLRMTAALLTEPVARKGPDCSLTRL